MSLDFDISKRWAAITRPGNFKCLNLYLTQNNGSSKNIPLPLWSSSACVWNMTWQPCFLQKNCHSSKETLFFIPSFCSKHEVKRMTSCPQREEALKETASFSGSWPLMRWLKRKRKLLQVVNVALIWQPWPTSPPAKSSHLLYFHPFIAADGSIFSPTWHTG